MQHYKPILLNFSPFLNNKHQKKMLDHHCCLNFRDNLLNFKIPCTFRKFLQLHTYSLTFFCGKKWTSICRCTHRFDVYFTSLYIIIIYIIYLYTYVSHPKGHIYKFPKKMKKKLCFFYTNWMGFLHSTTSTGLLNPPQLFLK